MESCSVCELSGVDKGVSGLGGGFSLSSSCSGEFYWQGEGIFRLFCSLLK